MIRQKQDDPRGILKNAGRTLASYRHARFHASEALAPYVEHFWLVEWDLTGKEAERAETLPHPSVHMSFESGGKSRIGGPSTAKFSVTLEGKGGVFAVKFTPGGFYPFCGGPVSAFANTTVPIGKVFGAEGDKLERMMLSATSDEESVSLLEAFLLAWIPPAPDENVFRANEIVDAVAQHRTILKVDDLVDRFAITKRTLQRLFDRYVGVSPKWVIQRYRLHEAAEKLAAPGVDQAALAHNLGYSDQAHFVRDFKSIIGTTPAAYARSVSENQVS